MHPRSKHWHLIDYVIVRRCDLDEVQIARAMRGQSTPLITAKSVQHCDYLSDHLLTDRGQCINSMYMLPTAKTSEELCNAIAQSLSHISMTTTLNCTSNLAMEWQALSSALLIASQSTLGNMGRRHQDWFDDNAADICSLIHDVGAARNALSRNPTSRTLHERFSSMRVTVQRKLRWMENNWWAQKVAQIQSYANINDAKSFYEALMAVYWPSCFSWHTVRTTDGVLIKNKELILA